MVIEMDLAKEKWAVKEKRPQEPHTNLIYQTVLACNAVRRLVKGREQQDAKHRIQKTSCNQVRPARVDETPRNASNEDDGANGLQHCGRVDQRVNFQAYSSRSEWRGPTLF